MVHVPSPPELVVRPLQRFRWREWAALALLWFASLIVVAVVVWLMHERVALGGSDSLDRAIAENGLLKQRVAVLERADQVARTASAELQRQIGQRQEEIAGLRADLAFYSRLTDASAAREGLSVEGLSLKGASAPRMYDFTITLTQNLKPGQIANGRVKLSVKGIKENQLSTLSWIDVTQDQDANGLAFSFKYFQQIKGTLLLPEGFVPNGVRVDADGGAQMGKAEREFGWTQALTSQGARNAG
ncbi:MAG: DUF6776 family protein [Rudaea sp.]